MAEQLYTTNEVCEILKITRRTLYRWIEDNKINAIKVGDTWRFAESEIVKFTAKDNSCRLIRAEKLLKLYESGELQELILNGGDIEQLIKP